MSWEKEKIKDIETKLEKDIGELRRAVCVLAQKFLENTRLSLASINEIQELIADLQDFPRGDGGE